MYDFEVSDEVPATPEAVYRAWLSSEQHSAMTGGSAVIEPIEGGEFRAWDDYIHGTNVKLEPHHLIVQTWRTQQFTDDDPDSQIEVILEPSGGGTKVLIRHSNVPDGQRGYEQGGWQKSYFDPMKAYFAKY